MYIYETEHLKESDLFKIEECGKRSLPIYYNYHHLQKFKIGNKQKIWVIKDIDNVYGFIIFEFKSPSYIHILSLAIDTSYRQKSLASHLMSHLKKKYTDFKITLYVQVSNLPAINFYVKHLFKMTKFLPHYYDNLSMPEAYEMTYLK